MEMKRCYNCQKLYECRRDGFGEWKVFEVFGNGYILQDKDRVEVNKNGIIFTCGCGETILWEFN
ncbi:MAG: hypothetical protein QW156_04710 [Candidatus Aenigmatarchaeota archaeon]